MPPTPTPPPTHTTYPSSHPLQCFASLVRTRDRHQQLKDDEKVPRLRLGGNGAEAKEAPHAWPRVHDGVRENDAPLALTQACVTGGGGAPPFSGPSLQPTRFLSRSPDASPNGFATDSNRCEPFCQPPAHRLADRS